MSALAVNEMANLVEVLSTGQEKIPVSGRPFECGAGDIFTFRWEV